MYTANTTNAVHASKEEAEAARLLSQQQNGATAASPQDANKANISSQEKNRRDTAVLKQAGVFDKLHEDAHRPPELEQVQVKVGKRSSVLLEGFEQKEAEARAMPKLVKVDSTDLTQSKLYDKLKEYEAKDAKAAAEPKLEKTLAQREHEKAVVAQ